MLPLPAGLPCLLGRLSSNVRPRGHSACTVLAAAAHGPQRETVPTLLHCPSFSRHQSVRGRRARARLSLARMANTVAVAVTPEGLIHNASPAHRATTVLAAVAGPTQWPQLGRRGACVPFRAALLSPGRRPNCHWSGRPPASRLGRVALWLYAAPRGQVAFPASAAQLER